VVAVDEGTTDATESIARSFAPAVRVVPAPASNAPGVTRQAGTEAATSPLIALLDADDLWLPHKLERQLAELAADPALDGVFAHVDEFLSPELTAEERRTVRAPLSGVAGRIASTLVIKRASLAVAGGFGNQAHPAEWIRWVSNAERTGLRLPVMPEVLVRRRIHASNLTRRHSGRFGPMLSTIRTHIEQARDREDG
jgi:glycosyltransferase involved in cell wall biosynthesis